MCARSCRSFFTTSCSRIWKRRSSTPRATPRPQDRIGWLRRLFDLACTEYDRLDLDRDDPAGALATEFRRGLDGVSESEVRGRLARIERLIGEWARGGKLYGHLYDDLLQLKYLHQRYTNYLRWLKTQ
jgi:MoxR-like ATPase